MPSNVQMNAGAGGSIATTKQITHDGDTTQCQGVHLLGISGTEDAYTAATINGDATNGLDVDVTRVIPGVTATALGKAEDAAHASGDAGVMALAVRKDTATQLADVDGDYSPLTTDASGRLHVNVGALPALPAGTNNIGDVDILSIAAGDNNIGNVDIVTMPNVTLAAGTNTNEVVGDVAHDSPVGGNPLLMGAEARTSDGTAVASGDVVRLLATLLGKQVNYPYALPGLDWHYAAASGGIVNTTGVTAKAAAGAGVRNYITRMEVINGHATVSTDFQIRDGAAGTVLWRGYLQAAGGGVAAVFDPPLRGTANTLVEIACGTTGSAVYANLHGFSAAE